MQATLAETMPSPNAGPEGPMVWLENGRGPIARGVVELLSSEGAHIRLIGTSAIEPSDELEVRLSLDRDSPSLGATARVLWVQESNDVTECELEWTHSGPERERLEALIAARS
jgi:hypothetical protein